MLYVFVVQREKEREKQKITGISGLGVFSKNGRFVTVNCFQKLVYWKPYFHSVLWVCACWAKLWKRALWTKKGTLKILLDNWKAHFLVCFDFSSFFCSVRVFFGFCLSVEGLRVRSPPHLALNSPYLFCFFVLEGVRVRWGGPKGHLIWPQTLVLLLFCFFLFLCPFCFWKRNPVFPLKEAFLVFFQCLPLLLPGFFPFPFSLSLFLCLSPVLFFLASFLVSFFLAFFCCLVLVSLFLCLVALLLFHAKSNIKTWN